MTEKFLFTYFLIFLSFLKLFMTSTILINTQQTTNTSFTINCLSNYQNICPSFNLNCKRVILDNTFNNNDILQLHNIAKKGMSSKDSGGPTILDINTGFIRDSNSLENLFINENLIYTKEDFEVYGNIINHLKNLVSLTFGLSVHFTTPTFITRLDGRSSWEPSEIHDEYWHIHSDMNNTEHYHFSGLLYMSTYQTDFTGGRILFYPSDIDPNLPVSEADQLAEQIIEPKAGRVVIFSSGYENPHRVERLLSGQRFVLAFWFTCNPDREFEIFLDGSAHVTFSKKVKSQLEQQQQQQQQPKNSNKRRRGRSSKIQEKEL